MFRRILAQIIKPFRGSHYRFRRRAISTPLFAEVQTLESRCLLTGLGTQTVLLTAPSAVVAPGASENIAVNYQAQDAGGNTATSLGIYFDVFFDPAKASLTAPVIASNDPLIAYVLAQPTLKQSAVTGLTDPLNPADTAYIEVQYLSFAGTFPGTPTTLFSVPLTATAGFSGSTSIDVVGNSSQHDARFNSLASSSLTLSAPLIPTVQVTDNGGVYTGNPFAASGTVTGASNVPGSTLETVGLTFTYYSGSTASGTPLSGAPSTVGTYTVVANFTGSTDYASASASITFNITKATPTVSVSGGGVYTGSPLVASSTVTGVSGTPGSSLESISPTLTYFVGSDTTGTNLGSTAPTAVGTYTVVANYAGSTDYGSANAQQTFQITKATPTVQVTDNGGTYTGNPYSATGTITGVSGTPGSTLESVGLTFTYYSGSTASGTPLSGAPTTVGTYTVVASFTGSTDYSSASASTTFNITKATPTVQVTDNGGTYTGNPYSATGTITGVSGTPGSTLETVGLTFTYYSGSTASGTPLAGAPSTVGTYTVVANFAGSADYSSASTSTTFNITKSTPTVQVADNGGVYTGNPFAASGTITGVSGTPGSTLETVGLTFTYYSGSTASGTPLSGAPSTVGTYTVMASFAGSTDYSSASASTTFSITKSTPTVRVTDNSGAYTGNSFTATGTVTGVSGTSSSTLETVA